jgi:hypothetical protein
MTECEWETSFMIIYNPFPFADHDWFFKKIFTTNLISLIPFLVPSCSNALEWQSRSCLSTIFNNS